MGMIDGIGVAETKKEEERVKSLIATDRLYKSLENLGAAIHRLDEKTKHIRKEFPVVEEKEEVSEESQLVSRIIFASVQVNRMTATIDHICAEIQ